MQNNDLSTVVKRGCGEAVTLLETISAIVDGAQRSKEQTRAIRKLLKQAGYLNRK